MPYPPLGPVTAWNSRSIRIEYYVERYHDHEWAHEIFVWRGVLYKHALRTPSPLGAIVLLRAA